eukprot:CAMPEP_0182556160 /NCGR_PEP_ID=MMETSP1324-20130603/527_1 /TAXON_ID=236786 /ORGANISM="Florenciella sp., Strain RCC1587" /LENGTH=60 /DNA_ID=CAMNT_0024768007 /DNA_START=207 /DNA_END=386 /DNA_ORIENTATION=+
MHSADPLCELLSEAAQRIASRDRARREIVDTTEAVDLAGAGQDAGTVVDEKEKERDRYAP